MRPAGLLVYEETCEKSQLIYDIRTEVTMLMPDDLIDALRNNTVAYNNFINFPPSSRKLYILWLNSAKRAATRMERIAKIIERSAKNIKAGMM